jgi:Mn2+/Fe2+ NRAMP family transporter
MSEVQTTTIQDAAGECQNPPASWFQRLRFLGPSLVLTASLVGSGELIVTTILGAKLGFVALWIIVVSCVGKVAIQEALGRYTISSGETSLQAFNRLPGPRLILSWSIWIWIAVVLLTVLQMGGIAILVGESITLILPQLSSQQWAPIVCAITLMLLLSGRYEVVERLSTLFVVIFSISTVASAVLLQSTPYAITSAQLLDGFKFRLPEAGAGIILAVVAAVGLSSTDLLFYPYWCLEKGYARFTGPNEPTAEWSHRAKGWIQVMQMDCVLALVIYTSTTLAFYLLGAAVLNARGDVPAGMNVVKTLAAMYTETLGRGAFYFYVVAAFSVLYSTLFVSVAAYSRFMTDCLRLFGRLSSAEGPRRRCNRAFLIFFATLYALLSQLPSSPVSLVILGLSGVGLMLPLVCFAAVYLRFRHLDPRLRPSGGLDSWLCASAILTSALTLYALFRQ